MAITEWWETSDDLSGSLSQDHVLEATRSFLVRCDRPTNIAAILLDPRLPKPYTRHPLLPKAVATTPVVRASRSARLWQVTVPYSSEMEEADEQQRSPNPLSRPPKISLTGGFEQVPCLKDRDGKPIVNKAGDKLAGAVMDRVIGTIRVERNYAQVPPGFTEYLKDGGAINSDTIKVKGMTFKEETLKLTSFEFGDDQIEDGVRFVPAVFTITAKVDTWHLRLHNEGYRERVKRPRAFGSEEQELTNELTPILVGNPPKATEEPIFLDKDGRAYRETVTVGQEVVRVNNLKPSEILELEFKIYPKLPFRKLLY